MKYISSMGSLSNLVNPQAIQLTKANAYRAAQIVLGTSAPQSQLIQVASQYTAFVIPRANRALSLQQILGDVDFVRFTSAAKDSTDSSVSEKISKAEKMVNGEFGLSESPLGVPNWLVYAGLGVGGYFLYKKKKTAGWKFFSKPVTAAAVVPKA